MPVDDDTRKVLAQLKVAEEFAAKLGRTTSIKLDLSQASADKMTWLDESGRPFIAINDALADAVCAAMQERIEDVFTGGEGHAAVGEIFAAGTKAVRTHVQYRFSAQGGDVTLAPLSAAWKARKARMGFSTMIGIYTRQLLNEWASARIEFV